MWIVVGLGNPGTKYSLNRHNVGFMALDAYCASVASAGGRIGPAPKWKDEKQALVTRLKMENVEVLFVKPQSYMNNSGIPVQALMHFYKIPLENLIVLHDEIDIGFGAIKIQKNRGPGGHNGLKSINEKLGTQDYVRLKLGVGRPSHPGMDVASYVLQDFSSEEQTHLHDFLSVAGDAVESLIFDGYDKAATKFTRKAVALPSAGAEG
jgi:PTH1 family peptidyl-tRNA hydrolase